MRKSWITLIKGCLGFISCFSPQYMGHANTKCVRIILRQVVSSEMCGVNAAFTIDWPICPFGQPALHKKHRRGKVWHLLSTPWPYLYILYLAIDFFLNIRASSDSNCPSMAFWCYRWFKCFLHRKPNASAAFFICVIEYCAVGVYAHYDILLLWSPGCCEFMMITNKRRVYLDIVDHPMSCLEIKLLMSWLNLSDDVACFGLHAVFQGFWYRWLYL